MSSQRFVDSVLVALFAVKRSKVLVDTIWKVFRAHSLDRSCVYLIEVNFLGVEELLEILVVFISPTFG